MNPPEKREGLTIRRRPQPKGAHMVVGFSGWMDGGEVATGALQYLTGKLHPEVFAEIDPEPFYIYNFPGSMEFSALFRPHTAIKEGIIEEYVPPANVFFFSEQGNLVLFEGKEPNVAWSRFSDLVLDVAEDLEVKRIYFIGSYAGVTPHTREPRFSTTVSDPSLKDELAGHGFRFSNYEGPSGIVTHLIADAGKRGIPMASLVAEIPAYLQGRNPVCIESVLRALTGLLGLDVDLSDLHEEGRRFQAQVTKTILDKDDLKEMVHKLEVQYDSDYLETEMGDLRQWLEDQGFHLP